MATVSRESIGLLNDKITVTVTKEDYYPAFEKGLKEYAKKANVPGFRKGMVPTGVLKKMYGHALFSEQVIKVVEKEIDTYLNSLTEKLLGKALPYNTEDQKAFDYNNPIDYSFSFEIGIEPEINIDFNKANLTRYKIAVTDALIEEDIAGLRTSYGKYSEPETVSSVDHYVEFEAEASDVEGNILNDADVTKPLNLLVKHFTEAYQSKVLGLSLNNVLVIKLADAFAAQDQEAIIKDLGIDKDTIGDAFYKCTLVKIGQQEPADMNEEFFKKAMPQADIKTEEELRAALKEEIANMFYLQSVNQLQDQIYHLVVDHSHIDLPVDFLKRLLKLDSANISEEEAEKQFNGYLKSFKWSLIIEKYSREFNVTVDKQDYVNYAKARLQNYMQSNGMGGGMNEEWLNQYAEEALKDKKFIEESYYEIRSKKVLDALDKTITPAEKEIDFETFKGMLHHHHH